MASAEEPCLGRSLQCKIGGCWPTLAIRPIRLEGSELHQLPSSRQENRSLVTSQFQHGTTISHNHADRAGSGRRCRYAVDRSCIQISDRVAGRLLPCGLKVVLPQSTEHSRRQRWLYLHPSHRHLADRLAITQRPQGHCPKALRLVLNLGILLHRQSWGSSDY
jgi:hypothetical protein